jgi:hypothetical protein
MRTVSKQLNEKGWNGRLRTVCRSLLMALILALFSWGKPNGVHAGTPSIEAELGPHGGTASGEFRGAGCASAPAARIRYQGFGARVNLRPADAFERRRPIAAEETPEPRGRLRASRKGPWTPEGATLELAAAVRYERYALLEPGMSSTNGDVSHVPEPLLRGAASLRAGYDFRFFGARGGLLVHQRYDQVEVTDCLDRPRSCPLYDSLRVRAFPEVAIRVGAWEPVHIDAGLGSYNLPTLHQPGLYAGLGFQLDGFGAAFHVGSHDTFHGAYSNRFDLSVLIPVSEELRLTAGASLGEGHASVPQTLPFATSEWEGQSGVELTLPGK